jgi:hypothetical protein
MLLAGTLPVLDSALPGENLPWWWFRYKEPPMITNLKGARIFQLGVGPVRSYDSPVHQLQERHPSSRQHLDDANQHHLVEGDIIVRHPPLSIPLGVLNKDLFAVLNTVQYFPISYPPPGIKLTTKNWRMRLATCLTNLSRVTGFLKGVRSLSWTCCSEGAYPGHCDVTYK